MKPLNKTADGSVLASDIMTKAEMKSFGLGPKAHFNFGSKEALSQFWFRLIVNRAFPDGVWPHG